MSFGMTAHFHKKTDFERWRSTNGGRSNSSNFAFGTHATPKPFMAASKIWLTRVFFESHGGQE